MDIKTQSVSSCYNHAHFHSGCHACLVETVITLCELLENHPNLAQPAKSEASQGLQEVFAGTTIAQFTDGWTTNVRAIPMTQDDIRDGKIRYTVEFSKRD